MLSAHCRSCGQPLGDAAERKLGRHAGCPASYDEDTLLLLKEWRTSQAKQQSVPAYCVFTDATLMAIAEARPQTPADLIKISGLGSAKASKYGEHVLAILAAPSAKTAAAGAEESAEKGLHSSSLLA